GIEYRRRGQAPHRVPAVMTVDQIRALRSLSFDQTENEDDVWNRTDFHVEGLHPEVESAIRERLAEAAARPRHNPVGLIIQGEPGVGKTRLLNWTRVQVQLLGGYFFLFYSPDATQGVWEQMLTALRTGLIRQTDNGRTQLERL